MNSDIPICTRWMAKVKSEMAEKVKEIDLDFSTYRVSS